MALTAEEARLAADYAQSYPQGYGFCWHTEVRLHTVNGMTKLDIWYGKKVLGKSLTANTAKKNLTQHPEAAVPGFISPQAAVALHRKAQTTAEWEQAEIDLVEALFPASLDAYGSTDQGRSRAYWRLLDHEGAVLAALLRRAAIVLDVTPIETGYDPNED
jgi:hypothetical protein